MHWSGLLAINWLSLTTANASAKSRFRMSYIDPFLAKYEPLLCPVHDSCE